MIGAYGVKWLWCMNRENANKIKELNFLLRVDKCNKFNKLFVFMHQSQTVGSESDATLAAVDTQEVDASMTPEWSRILLDGFGYTDDADRQRGTVWNRMLRSRPEVEAVIAAIDGQSVGSASVMILGTTAVLGGATTLPAFRRRGGAACLDRSTAVSGHPHWMRVGDHHG